MHRAAVQSAVMHASSPAMGIGIPLAEGAVGITNVRHAKYIAPPVPVVARRHRYLFSHEMADLCIAAIVTNRNVLVARTTDDRAGNLYDRNLGESR